MTESDVETLALPGLVCPMPVLRTKKRLAQMAPGERLRVISTDPHSVPDLAEFCRQTGHHLLAQNEEELEGAKAYATLIERKAE